MTFEKAAETIGMDLEGVLARFSGNKALLMRFVKKFTNDQTFPHLKEAIAQKNWQDIETYAHTLKGVSGNLGFTSLYELSSAIVSKIRGKQQQEAEALFSKTIECCQNIIDTINAIDA